MAAKWIVRGLQNPQETWAILLFRNMKKFTLKGKPKWDNLPNLTIWASKYDMAPKGSPLSVSIWKSWFKLKKNVKPTEQIQKCLGSHERDSIWWPTLIGRPIDQAQEEEALQLHRKGLKEWKDIWDKENHYWKLRATLIANFNVTNQQINLLG